MSAGECARGCYCELPADAVVRSERTEAKTLDTVFVYENPTLDRFFGSGGRSLRHGDGDRCGVRTSICFSSPVSVTCPQWSYQFL